MEIILFVAILLFILWPILRYRKPIRGVFVSETGKKYRFKVGAHLSNSGYRFNGLQIIVPYNLPTLVIDGHKNSQSRGIASMMRPSEKYRMELEGTFYKHFAVYCPRQIQTAAPYLLPPTTMQFLMDRGSDYDIDIFGREMSIIASGNTDKNPEVRDELIGFAKAFIKHIEPRLIRWNNENPDFKTKDIRGSSSYVKVGRKIVQFDIGIILVVLILVVLLISVYS